MRLLAQIKLVLDSGYETEAQWVSLPLTEQEIGSFSPAIIQVLDLDGDIDICYDDQTLSEINDIADRINLQEEKHGALIVQAAFRSYDTSAALAALENDDFQVLTDVWSHETLGRAYVDAGYIDILEHLIHYIDTDSIGYDLCQSGEWIIYEIENIAISWNL